ncbi:hypothetical protein BGW38_010830 [Lunasporangiospora selenospora]|uniref:Glutathione S-transferase n=1 Tax=Lunasporangiospora selenospora TaxID=979761 RepID=A0A9P6FX65_9FUNG|nr:hypothetical protein BGW38_010830 [Lunasporangiospora selenospora]
MVLSLTKHFDPTQAAAYNSTGTSSTFEIHYVGVLGVAQNALALLSIADVPFKYVLPDNQDEAKKNSTFGFLPVLKETTADGTVLTIAESDAIERYLAKKFGFYGSNLFEETAIDQVLANTNAFIEQIHFKFFGLKDPAAQAEVIQAFVSTIIPKWAKHHEALLVANGSNGHYLGDKLTLADIRTATIISAATFFSGEEIVSETKTPALWKLKTSIEAIPSYVAWRKTDTYKALALKNKELIGF